MAASRCGWAREYAGAASDVYNSTAYAVTSIPTPAFLTPNSWLVQRGTAGAQAVREKEDADHHHAKHKRRDEQEHQAKSFVFEVHEEGHDHARFDDGEAHQYRQHDPGRDLIVGQQH